jgi:hypothetical protein
MIQPHENKFFFIPEKLSYPLNVGAVLNKMAPEQIFISVFRVSPVSIIPPLLHIHSRTI